MTSRKSLDYRFSRAHADKVQHNVTIKGFPSVISGIGQCNTQWQGINVMASSSDRTPIQLGTILKIKPINLHKHEKVSTKHGMWTAN